jgi:hypothetical protein
MTHDLRCYDYVNRPLAQVRELLVADPRALFQRATTVATSRAQALRAQLHASLGPLELAAEVDIRVTSVEEAHSPLEGPATRIALEWHATHATAAFPVMHAVLSAYALTPTETQLELEGTYAPPLGVIGKAVDAVIGRRIAEASMHRFVEEVAARLREELEAGVARAG